MTAVSEIIGTILLISIVVLAASVIAVAVFSQPQAQKIPALSALISNQSQVVSIKHDGGDSLANGTYKILVDGIDVTSNITITFNVVHRETLTYTKPGTNSIKCGDRVYRIQFRRSGFNIGVFWDRAADDCNSNINNITSTRNFSQHYRIHLMGPGLHHPKRNSNCRLWCQSDV